MTFINITKFVLINELEKDHSMIEKCCNFYPDNINI